ncbi:MAG: hypothetical protein BRD42_04560 [Bacteroidetes bacterium QS_3_64_15]|nr:MAG: hypothetical protein BRD42_04560 [Bacteroidetes bacterium QS_3_64_15]
MLFRRPSLWILLLIATVGLVGCEPYMSLTDRIPTQTRQATALLPEAPRFAGMVDLETVMGNVDTFGGADLVDSLRRAEESRLGTVLAATGMDPETDLKAVYGTLEDGDALSAVVFADLSPDQVDRYLDRAPGEAGRAATYRDVPVYHLALGAWASEEASVPDTLSLGFVRSGTIAAAMDAGRVEAMIDRHRDQAEGFRDNESYMTLVERVGHGSTAWLVGRDVLQTALHDPGASGAASSSDAPRANRTGFQQLLSAWADRMLGLSDASSALEGSAGSKIDRLKSRIREQAVSVTLTDEALEGKAYLTMRDETSAANVVDVSKGAIAALRLSEKEIEGVTGDLLNEVTIERDGPVVHVQCAVDRARVRKAVETRTEGRAAHRSKSSIRRAKGTVRRRAGITRAAPALRPLHVSTETCNLCADRPVSRIARGTGESG